MENRYCNEKTCFIKFKVSSKGFASNSCYLGFYYTDDDIKHQYEFSDRTIKGFTTNSYTVEETGSDNILYLKKIKKHWYYFEECY